MFFKVIYYLIGIGIVLFNLLRLADKTFSRDLFEWYELFQEKKKEGKEKEAFKVIEDDKDFLTKIVGLLIGAILESIWFLVGVFTFNWAIILTYIIFSFFMYRISLNALNNHQLTSYVKQVNFKTGVSIAVILFAIINSFHLHIDLIKLIFGA